MKLNIIAFNFFAIWRIPRQLRHGGRGNKVPSFFFSILALSLRTDGRTLRWIIARLFLSRALARCISDLSLSIKKRLESFFWSRHFGGAYRPIYRSIFAFGEPWAIAFFRIALITSRYIIMESRICSRAASIQKINAIALEYTHVCTHTL